MMEFDFTEQKELREQCIGRVEVLDKVKSLFLIPKLEVMTVRQVAEYYEVGLEAIQSCYKDNTTEIDADGTVFKKYAEFLPVLQGQVKIGHGRTEYIAGDMAITIPRNGSKCFSKRAVLRIGMLLRDSEVAKEVRTQLLNTFEHATEVQRTYDIGDERCILTGLIDNLAKGNTNDAFKYFADYVDFQNRKVTELQTNNKLLAANILEWSDRSKLNKAIRQIAAVTCQPFGYVWKELYNELLYKHNMCLAIRGKKPLTQHIRVHEWPNVQQSLAAIPY